MTDVVHESRPGPISFGEAARVPAAGVAADMAAIFGSARTTPRHPHRRAPVAAPTPPARSRRWYGSGPAIALGGAAGMVLAAWTLAGRGPAVAEPHARPVAGRAADPDLRPASLVSPAPAAPLAPVTADATVSPAADAPAAPPPERYDEAPANAQAFAPAHRRPALRGPRPRYAARWDDGGCDDGDGGRFACGRGAVLHADRTLRAAYAAAVDAGVDRDRLVSIRNRWARLRMAEHDRPGALIEDYAELTDRLLRHADEAGGERE